MTDRILIFSDHTGNERFFLRFAGTADEFQNLLERWADRSKEDTDWSTIATLWLTPKATSCSLF
ncbi:MAG: hypothetical protein JO170_20330 [Verrucomicrobia bacterium]|nr:hypothetical protein [Verrucomicrobiota bacterium]